MRYILLACLTSQLSTGCLTPTGQSSSAETLFDPNRPVQAEDLESRWPPIGNDGFQSALLGNLQRTGRADDVRLAELTSLIGPEMGQFCNAPPAIRRELFATTIARIPQPDYARYVTMLNAHCNMKVFGTSAPAANIYVVVYGSAKSGTTRRGTYTDPHTPDTIVTLHISEDVRTAAGAIAAKSAANSEYLSWRSGM